MSRIQLTDNIMDVFTKMSDGNPGALTAMMELHTCAEDIDPQAMMGGLGPLLSLDTHEIYGTDIYILWNDKCGRDVRKLLMLLRAVQLGFMSSDKLCHMASDQMRKVNLSEDEMADFDKQVCDRLPNFQRAA